MSSFKQALKNKGREEQSWNIKHISKTPWASAGEQHFVVYANRKNKKTASHC